MRTVYHPIFSDVSFEVGEVAAQEWKAAGWRFTPIAKPESQPEPKPKAPAVSKPAAD